MGAVIGDSEDINITVGEKTLVKREITLIDKNQSLVTQILCNSNPC